MHAELPQYENWTITAIQCYRIGCICENCSIIDGKFIYLNRENCQMKYAVRQLVRKYGVPEELKERTENETAN